MTSTEKKIKALGLSSGGLDSILAGMVLKEQGVWVEWVAFETPFFSADKAKMASERTGIPLYVRTITDRYMPMLLAPKAGYGKHMNPCMDCHALMLRLAGEMMAEVGASFLFSGEVVGQRPMSQTMPSLRYVEKNSDMDGYILRPLSAKLLPETMMEQNGWVDREKLYDFSGRNRKPQMALAKELGIDVYPTPGGGCLLTEEKYSRRLKDLIAHQSQYPEYQLELLEWGRHLRISPETKLIVGRTQSENEDIRKRVQAETDIILKTEKAPGPIAVICGNTASEKDIEICAAICAGYSKAVNGEQAVVRVEMPQEPFRYVEVVPQTPLENQKYLL